MSGDAGIILNLANSWNKIPQRNEKDTPTFLMNGWRPFWGFEIVVFAFVLLFINLMQRSVMKSIYCGHFTTVFSRVLLLVKKNFLMATGFYLQNSLKLQSSIVYLPMQTHWLSTIMDFHFYPLYVFKWHLPKQPWRYVPSLFLFCINIAELNRILANANKLISNNHWFSFLSTLHFQLTFT